MGANFAAAHVHQKNTMDIFAQGMLYLKRKLWVWCRNDWVRFSGPRHAEGQIRR